MKELSFDPENGFVIGLRGRPFTSLIRGYVRCTNHGRFLGFAHRLLWESVHGPIPPGMQINHINGIKSDNRIANLELVTPSENIQHSFRTGLQSCRGEKNGRALLTEADVRAIRASQLSTTELASRYGVAVATIRGARVGKSWSHIPMERAA